MESAVDELIEYGRRCYEQGLVVAAGGNLSCRLDPRGCADEPCDSLLVTGTGAHLGTLAHEDIVEVKLDGPVAGGNSSPALEDGDGRNRARPTSELPLHRALYQRFDAIRALVHTHSPAATAFACAGAELPLLTPEALATLGEVSVVPYRVEGSPELGQAAAAIIADREARQTPPREFPVSGAVLLERHGVICWGVDIASAFDVAEVVEQSARVAIYHGLLSGQIRWVGRTDQPPNGS